MRAPAQQLKVERAKPCRQTLQIRECRRSTVARWQVSRAAVFPMAFALLSAALFCQSTQTGRELQDCHTIISTMLQFLFNFYKCSSRSVLLLYLLLKKKLSTVALYCTLRLRTFLDRRSNLGARQVTAMATSRSLGLRASPAAAFPASNDPHL